MKRKDIKEGDLFFIQKSVYSDGSCDDLGDRTRVGKLIYISKAFRNAIGIIPSKTTFSTPPTSEPPYTNCCPIYGRQFKGMGDLKTFIFQ